MIIIGDADSIYRDLSANILEKGGYIPATTNSLEHLQEILRSERAKVKAVLIDFNILPKNNERLDFEKTQEFINDINIPVLFTSEENIDQYFSFIVKHGMKMVLSKPMKKRELLTALDKVLNPTRERCFGFENYVENLQSIKRIEINRSTQIRTAIDTILTQIGNWGFNMNQKFEMDLVWQEILVNAIYHAHGYTNEKLKRTPIELPAPAKIVIRYGHNGEQVAVSIRDFQGTLTPLKIIDSLSYAIDQQNLLERSIETGEDISEKIRDHGRGIDLVRRMSGEYYFITAPDESTEVITIYEKHYEKDDPYTSLKIIELPGSKN